MFKKSRKKFNCVDMEAINNTEVVEMKITMSKKVALEDWKGLVEIKYC
jgi:hypothetical protein